MFTNVSRLRYLLLAVALAVAMLNEDKQPAKAIYPLIAVARVQRAAPPKIAPKGKAIYPITASLRKQYLSTPSEISFPDKWTDPWRTKEGWTVSWLPAIESILATDKYPYVDEMMVMGVMIQESGGDPDVECVDKPGFICGGGGLMGIAPGRCGYTEQQLQDPYKNIECGIRMLNQIYGQVLEFGFRPGRDAIRATLGSYNCGYESLLANNCYSYGGFAYADLINNYWLPLLTTYLGD